MILGATPSGWLRAIAEPKIAGVGFRGLPWYPRGALFPFLMVQVTNPKRVPLSYYGFWLPSCKGLGFRACRVKGFWFRMKSPTLGLLGVHDFRV